MRNAYKTQSIIYTLIALSVFLLSNYAIIILRYFGIISTLTSAQFWLLNILTQVLFPVIIWILLLGSKKGLKHCGLIAPFLPALLIGLIATTPMWLGFWVLSDQPTQWPWVTLLKQAFITGLVEEALFRGLLFGMLFRCAGWLFLPAAGFAALLFGLGHLYQGGSFMSASSIFGITAIGSIWFSWLYLKWNFNLWVPIFMHALMNAWWIVFSVDQTAMGDVTANVLRMLTIGLSIVLTFIWNPQKQTKKEVS
ncbi:lysostaphin resistance A-like protein [Marinicella sp. W31]|uniref:CPBP family intramembrane glutamic endopeptidase n=1 Tax=Marinicella sp. W31 TaxID=3023713 RepID=UPI0037565341